MPIYFQPITTQEYPDWFSYSTTNYPMIKFKQTMGTARKLWKEHKKTNYLPNGVDTPNHHICHIVDSDSNKRVGRLWWYLSGVWSSHRFYLRYSYLSKGPATRFCNRSPTASQGSCSKKQVEALSLHVFAFNTEAINSIKNWAMYLQVYR